MLFLRLFCQCVERSVAVAAARPLRKFQQSDFFSHAYLGQFFQIRKNILIEEWLQNIQTTLEPDDSKTAYGPVQPYPALTKRAPGIKPNETKRNETKR